MRLCKPRRQYGCEISMAPLIDIVFLLIIFFMTVSHAARLDPAKLTLPEAVKGESPRETPIPTVVNVLADGQAVVGGEIQTETTLRQLLARFSAGQSPEQATVTVRADRNTPWEYVSVVLKTCAAERIGNVRVAVTEAEQK